MITPDFKITQEPDTVVIEVRVPYVKISSSEVYVESNQFYFYLKPYFLKLQFSQDLREGDEAIQSSVYDHNTYLVTFKVIKRNPGEQFKDLDIISKLFEKKSKTSKVKPKITVLNSTSTGEKDDIGEDQEGFILVKPGSDESYNYGFDYGFDDFFGNHQEELHELADLDPASTTIGERKKALYMIEARSFDPDHYVCNFFDSKTIEDLMKPELQLPIKGKLTKLVDVKAENIKYSLVNSGT